MLLVLRCSSRRGGGLVKRAARSPRDPRVVEILKVFDHTVTHPFHADPAIGSGLDGFLQNAIGFQFEEWPDSSVRAVLLAYLLHAPGGDLDEMLDAARAHLEWLAEFELSQKYEETTGGSCYSDEFKAWLALQSAEAN